jgi:aminopeptidase
LKNMPSNLMESLQDVSVTFFLAAPKEGELTTVREPFIQKVISRARHAHMVGVTEEILQTGMCADYSKIETITNKLYEMLKTAKQISVKSQAGTDFTASFNTSTHWISCTGICRKVGEWDNLPSGEVFTAPETLGKNTAASSITRKRR